MEWRVCKLADLGAHPPYDRKAQSFCGEMLARKMLANYCGQDPQELRFARTDKGKLYALNCAAQFSIAHAGEYVACAVDDAPLGIDLEPLQPRDLKLSRKVCTARELEYLAPEEEGSLRRFYRIWTAKEAYFKALGTGITDLKSISYFDLLPRLQQVETEEYILTIYQ